MKNERLCVLCYGEDRLFRVEPCLPDYSSSTIFLCNAANGADFCNRKYCDACPLMAEHEDWLHKQWRAFLDGIDNSSDEWADAVIKRGLF